MDWPTHGPSALDVFLVGMVALGVVTLMLLIHVSITWPLKEMARDRWEAFWRRRREREMRMPDSWDPNRPRYERRG